MKRYIQSAQYYAQKECYIPRAGSPVSAKIQVIHVAVTGCPEHGCDTARFFYRTSPVILPWCPSKSKFFCLSPTAFVLPHFVQLPPQFSFSSSRTRSSLTFEPLLTILKFLVTSTASAAFPSHMCNSHLTLHLHSSFPNTSLPF